jgi:tetratricopeptide (TPR) repeat protein
MNWGIIEYRAENYDISEKLLNEVIMSVTNLPDKSIKYKGFYFTSEKLFDNDIFKLKWEKSLYQFYNSKDELDFSLTDLILSKTFEILGDIYRKQYSYDLSEEMYKLSLQLVDDGFENTKFNLSYVLFKLNKYDESIEYLNSLLIREPFNFEALLLLSDIHKVNNNIELYKDINKKIISYSKIIPNSEIYYQKAIKNFQDL